MADPQRSRRVLQKIWDIRDFAGSLTHRFSTTFTETFKGFCLRISWRSSRISVLRRYCRDHAWSCIGMSFRKSSCQDRKQMSHRDLAGILWKSCKSTFCRASQDLDRFGTNAEIMLLPPSIVLVSGDQKKAWMKMLEGVPTCIILRRDLAHTSGTMFFPLHTDWGFLVGESDGNASAGPNLKHYQESVISALTQWRCHRYDSKQQRYNMKPYVREKPRKQTRCTKNQI